MRLLTSLMGLLAGLQGVRKLKHQRRRMFGDVGADSLRFPGGGGGGRGSGKLADGPSGCKPPVLLQYTGVPHVQENAPP